MATENCVANRGTGRVPVRTEQKRSALILTDPRSHAEKFGLEFSPD